MEIQPENQETQEILSKKIKVSETVSQNVAETVQKDTKNQDQNESDDNVSVDLSVTSTQMQENADRRIFLRGFQKFELEKDIFKFANKLHPNAPEKQFDFTRIYKEKGKFVAIIEFTDNEQAATFLKQFQDPKNSKIVKKLRYQKRDARALNLVKKKGKPIEHIQRYIEKKSVIRKATPEELEEQRKITIVQQVCPLLETPYEEQIKQKKQDFQRVLQNWKKQAAKTLQGPAKFYPLWVQDREPMQITDVIECDEQDRLRYRNKMEFTVGKDLDGEIVVGMNKGSQAKGTINVANADTCTVLSEEGLMIARVFQDYIRSRLDELEHFDRYTQKGYFKNISIRQSFKTKQIMIIIIVQKDDISQELVEKEKQNYIDLFINNQPEGLKNILQKNQVNIVSLNVQYTQKSEGQACDEPIENISGSACYQEQILGKTFNVSPKAFLQNHTRQTDKLYQLIADLVKEQITENAIFLDVCSGIGTIGMCMAENCKEIVGIEMVKDACDAAEENKKLNNIQNYEVICSKVEDVMAQIITKYKEQDPNIKIIAVVDPPRAGLHKSVVKALRGCQQIDQLIYVACSPQSIVENLNFLCLPSGQQGRTGVPFNPHQSYVIDLFPMTSHYEGLFVLKRFTEGQSNEETKIETEE